MNHTTDSSSSSSSSSSSGSLGSSNNISGFSYGYGIGVSIGILLIIAITIASYFCTRQHPPTPSNTRTINIASNSPQPPQDHSAAVVVDVGLNEATILSYPKLLYSEARVQKPDSLATCCTICLGDYKSSDMIRVLPDCGHLFHSKCIHPWLRLHSRCPLCRTSPMPTPLSTPLAGVVPLASRRDP